MTWFSSNEDPRILCLKFGCQAAYHFLVNGERSTGSSRFFQCHLGGTWSCSLVLEERWSCNNWSKPNALRKALNWTHLDYNCFKEQFTGSLNEPCFKKILLAPTLLVRRFSLLNSGWSQHASAVRLRWRCFQPSKTRERTMGLMVWFVAFCWSDFYEILLEASMGIRQLTEVMKVRPKRC